MTHKTIEDFIAELATEYPTLTKGVNDEVIQLDAKEYNDTIASWAEDRFAKQTEAEAIIAKTEAEAQAAVQRAALLEKLGITSDEAKLLLQ